MVRALLIDVRLPLCVRSLACRRCRLAEHQPDDPVLGPRGDIDDPDGLALELGAVLGGREHLGGTTVGVLHTLHAGAARRSLQIANDRLDFG